MVTVLAGAGKHNSSAHAAANTDITVFATQQAHSQQQPQAFPKHKQHNVVVKWLTLVAVKKKNQD